MKVVGIVAEYNPFHNGHKFHMEQARHLTGADYVIVVMSGNFTQRGNPALVDKYTRTRMALESGADLVIELPVYYACTSAEFFAKGAIALLDKLGIVDSICFGSECGDIRMLTKIASVLHNETDEFKLMLKAYLKEGKTFPQARTLALEATIMDFAGHSSVLASPNNILGIEYIRALMALNSSITPYTNLRIGSAYHEKRLSEHNSSAIAIRQSLEERDDLLLIKGQVPDSAYELMEANFHKTFPIFANDLSSLLKYKLLLEEPTGFSDFIDVSEDLSSRIANNLYQYTNFNDFCDLLKTRDMTYARISRCLIHVLLDLRKSNLTRYWNSGIVSYARMLGFKKSSTELLSALKASSEIPLISKLANAASLLNDSEFGIEMLNADILAAHIYDSMTCDKFGHPPVNEFIRNIVMI